MSDFCTNKTRFAHTFTMEKSEKYLQPFMSEPIPSTEFYDWFGRVVSRLCGAQIMRRIFIWFASSHEFVCAEMINCVKISTAGRTVARRFFLIGGSDCAKRFRIISANCWRDAQVSFATRAKQVKRKSINVIILRRTATITHRNICNDRELKKQQVCDYTWASKSRKRGLHTRRALPTNREYIQLRK